MTLNCIWLWGSSSRDLRIEEYLILSITPRSSRNWSQTDLFKIILIRSELSMPYNCKLFVLRIKKQTWSYNYLQRITIIIIIIICIIKHRTSEFFTQAFAGGQSSESKWQQVASGLQDSSHYDGQS